jgi:NAD(P)-dependent dehydrogenase (short-subunit alcohol dehydrogenase family)
MPVTVSDASITSSPDRAAAPNVLITGAAGALGREVAQLFAGQSARLALLDQDLGRLTASFGDAGLHPDRLLLAADVTSSESMQNAVQQVIERFQHIDVLVHVAGGFEMGEMTHALSRASWDRMMNLNAWSFVAVTGSVIPSMVLRGAGKVIAVSAQSAVRGQAAMAAYVASKSALQRLVESLSAEVAPDGVHVNSVAPTILDTPANRSAMPSADPASWVSLAAAARAIGFLASSASEAVHGRHLVLGD